MSGGGGQCLEYQLIFMLYPSFLFLFVVTFLLSLKMPSIKTRNEKHKVWFVATILVHGLLDQSFLGKCL